LKGRCTLIPRCRSLSYRKTKNLFEVKEKEFRIKEELTQRIVLEGTEKKKTRKKGGRIME